MGEVSFVPSTAGSAVSEEWIENGKKVNRSPDSRFRILFDLAHRREHGAEALVSDAIVRVIERHREGEIRLCCGDSVAVETGPLSHRFSRFQEFCDRAFLEIPLVVQLHADQLVDGHTEHRIELLLHTLESFVERDSHDFDVPRVQVRSDVAVSFQARLDPRYQKVRDDFLDLFDVR